MGSAVRARRGVGCGEGGTCNAPLATSHRVLGILSLGRLTPTPFTSDELSWVAQIAEQLALALENALAFDEIASLKDRLAHENIYLEEEIAAPSISERSSAKAGR